MTPDWSRVTLEHVRRACEMYDSGAARPKRPAQSTFLLLSGKSYPAKFIRGLAYRLATGVELDPTRDYSGGAETAKFFQALGLATQVGPSSVPAAQAAKVAALPPSTQPEAPPPGLRTGQSYPELPRVAPADLVRQEVGARIKKLALVSHDYNVTDSRGLFDYSEHFARINKLCDDQGCDTILYALYTWDRDSTVARNHDAIFGGLAHVQRVILEVGQPALESFDHVEVWLRGQQAPLVAHQRFATSSSPDASKRAFMDDLPARRVGNALLVICGETNIASTIRGSDDFSDPYGFADLLRDLEVGLILNPVHDYMRRYEMREKRRHYSLGGRTVISVWNQGKGKEAHWPWTVFQDGTERTEAVRELARPFSDRPDIRIGIVDLPSLLLKSRE